MVTAVDRRRLGDAARGLALPTSDVEVMPLAELDRLHESLLDAARAAQSLDDLGSPEANEVAWWDACELSRRADAVGAVLGRRRALVRLDAALRRLRAGDIAPYTKSTPVPFRVLAEFQPVRRPAFPPESAVDTALPSICVPYRRVPVSRTLRNGAVFEDRRYVPEWLREERLRCMAQGDLHARGRAIDGGVIRHRLDLFSLLTSRAVGRRP